MTVPELGVEAETKEIADRMERLSTGISGPLADLCGLGLLEKVSYGRYRIVDDPELALHNARIEAEEFERDEKIEAANRKRRISSRYYFDLLHALERGESPASVKRPQGFHERYVENVIARATAKAEEKKREAEAVRRRGTLWWSGEPLDWDPEVTTAEEVVLDFA